MVSYFCFKSGWKLCNDDGGGIRKNIQRKKHHSSSFEDYLTDWIEWKKQNKMFRFASRTNGETRLHHHHWILWIDELGPKHSSKSQSNWISPAHTHTQVIYLFNQIDGERERERKVCLNVVIIHNNNPKQSKTTTNTIQTKNWIEIENWE